MSTSTNCLHQFERLSGFELVLAVRQGLPVKALLEAERYFGVSRQMLLDMLSLSRYQYEEWSRTPAALLDEEVTDQLISLVDLQSRGVSYFGSVDTWWRWRDRPNLALAWHRPIELMGSACGRTAIVSELGVLNEGYPV